MSAGLLRNAFFKVDGVMLAPPLEQRWREALVSLAEPARFTTAVYREAVAGKPRVDRALAALQALGATDATGHVRLSELSTFSKQVQLDLTPLRA
jgi:hypothetical protein